jgi:hypothetical protein
MAERLDLQVFDWAKVAGIARHEGVVVFEDGRCDQGIAS